MSPFFRFPHTPHLVWLGAGAPRDDKLLPPDEAAALLAGEVTVEEKVDGANLGISIDPDGQVQLQNRGTYLARHGLPPQFATVWSWVLPRQDSLVDALWPDLMLFGEWCYAVHSIRYTRLPDWFLAFDVYDRAAGRFFSAARRDALCQELQLAQTPHLDRGHFTLAQIPTLLGPSRCTDGPMEGVVVRRDGPTWGEQRAKVVAAAFTQAIDGHWSSRALELNSLASV